MIVPTPALNRDTEQLAALALKARLPTTGGFLESAKGGLLIGYGPSLAELDRQAASYVVRLLNGAQAADLPFQGPTLFDFAINARTAKVLGLTIPASLLVGVPPYIADFLHGSFGGQRSAFSQSTGIFLVLPAFVLPGS